jgi:hypothetical protein
MAENHFKYNDQTNPGRALRSAINKLDEAVEELINCVEFMGEAKEEGVITSYLQGEYGCPTLGDAQGMVGEAEAVKGHFGEGSGYAALKQAKARIGT